MGGTVVGRAPSTSSYDGEDMHAPTERIRADSIVTGARQLRAVLQGILELPPRSAGLI